MQQTSKVYTAAHCGMVRSAILRLLQKNGFSNTLTSNSADLDLHDRNAVAAFLDKERPEYLFLAAAKVGGIMANNVYRAEFI